MRKEEYFCSRNFSLQLTLRVNETLILANDDFMLCLLFIARESTSLVTYDDDKLSGSYQFCKNY